MLFTTSVKRELKISHVVLEDDTAILQISSFINAPTEDAVALLELAATGNARIAGCCTRSGFRATTCFVYSKSVYGPGHRKSSNVLELWLGTFVSFALAYVLLRMFASAFDACAFMAFAFVSLALVESATSIGTAPCPLVKKSLTKVRNGW